MSLPNGKLKDTNTLHAHPYTWSIGSFSRALQAFFERRISKCQHPSRAPVHFENRRLWLDLHKPTEWPTQRHPEGRAQELLIFMQQALVQLPVCEVSKAGLSLCVCVSACAYMQKLHKIFVHVCSMQWLSFSWEGGCKVGPYARVITSMHVCKRGGSPHLCAACTGAAACSWTREQSRAPRFSVETGCMEVLLFSTVYC
jgi:hypothetical protein